MSMPSYPSANPGGQNARLVRHTLRDWIDAQHIPGIGRVHPSLQPLMHWDEIKMGPWGCQCFVFINLLRDTESRAVTSGPDNPGGKMIHYDVELQVRHRGFDPDSWEDSQDDYDRVVDALKDCLRASGRDLGRPDVIFQAGDWPNEDGMVHNRADPVNGDGGVVDRWGSLAFTISQYLPTFIPGAPA